MSKEKSLARCQKPPQTVARRSARAERAHDAGGKRRAVFFDRDGTLNKEVGHVTRLTHFELYPFAGQAVRKINEAGLLAIVVTNQSGVARGVFPEELVKQVHARLIREIRAEGGRLDGIYYCPHHPESPLERYRQECACRKPSPGMLEEAAARFGIVLEKSFVVGDRYVDVEMARRVGASSVLVLTGFGRDEWELYRSNGALPAPARSPLAPTPEAKWAGPPRLVRKRETPNGSRSGTGRGNGPGQPDHVADNVHEAVQWILRDL